MANRFPRGSWRAAVTAVLALAVAVVGVVVPNVAATATPTTSTESIPDVQRELGQLAVQNAQLVENYNQARIDVADKQKAAKKASAEAASASALYDDARGELVTSVVAQYEGGAFSATGALLSSEDGQGYLDEAQILSMISTYKTQVILNVSAAKRAADASAATATKLLAEAKATLAATTKKKAEVTKQINKYTKLLASLNEQQRIAFQARMSPAAPAVKVEKATAEVQAAASAPVVGSKSVSSSVSSQALGAVKFALAQVGKPYVFGAAGPNTFDCSGLTMQAYASVGISLPHSAAQQYNYGRKVSFEELRPGDLLFWHHPVGHVAMYIGDGLAVSAPQTGENVKIISAKGKGSYVGAVRLVG